MIDVRVSGKALARAVWQVLREPRPHPSWTRRQALVVYLVRDVIRQLVDASPERQRSVLAVPIPPRPRDIEEVSLELGGRPALQWSAPGADLSRRILHFHGGGYVIGHPRESRAYGCRLARAVGVPVVSVDYRLAPEHPHPAAMEDGEAAVRALVDQGIAPDHIVVTGDSAGGGVSLGTVLRLRDAGGPQVAGAILGSPGVDLTIPGASIDENAATDYIFRDIIERWHTWAAEDPSDPSSSPGRGDLSGLPPLRFVVGEVEVLRDDIVACAEKARAAGTDVEVYVGAGGVHCWYLDPLYPGPSDGSQRVAAMARSLLGL